MQIELQELVELPKDFMPSVEEAFAYCENQTKNHYENFPVGSALMPKEKRKYIWAIYTFARTADDIADEGRGPRDSEADLQKRIDQLDECEFKLVRSARGEAEELPYIALAKTLKDCDIPVQLLRDLLTAYRMDVRQSRYKTWEDVLFYCKHSANPVGRLVLHVFGYKEETLHETSDKICTALQLTNFWQDLAIDLAKDRIYVPQDDLKKFRVTEGDFHAKIINRYYEQLMEELYKRTAKLFNEGLPLLKNVKNDLKLEMRLTWLGGTAVLKKTKKVGYDIYRKRPSLSKLDFACLLSRALVPIPIGELK